MKSILKKSVLVVVLVVFGLTFTSCQKDSDKQEDSKKNKVDISDNSNDSKDGIPGDKGNNNGGNNNGGNNNGGNNNGGNNNGGNNNGDNNNGDNNNGDNNNQTQTPTISLAQKMEEVNKIIGDDHTIYIYPYNDKYNGFFYRKYNIVYNKKRGFVKGNTSYSLSKFGELTKHKYKDYFLMFVTNKFIDINGFEDRGIFDINDSKDKHRDTILEVFMKIDTKRPVKIISLSGVDSE